MNGLAPTGFAWLIRPAPGASDAAFDAATEVLRASCDELAIADRAPPRLNLLSLRRERFAFAIGSAPPPDLPEGATIEVYEVHSSAPVDGPSRGAAMLTLLHRKKGLADGEFLRRWHEGHSPLAIEVHPLTRYARHVVVRAIDGAPALDGIVLENVRERADLLAPSRYFGGPLAMVPNLVRVAMDANRFLDLGAIENYLVEVESGEPLRTP